LKSSETAGQQAAAGARKFQPPSKSVRIFFSAHRPPTLKLRRASRQNLLPKLHITHPNYRDVVCLIVAILGALGGGLAVMLATKALPEMMSGLGPKMMRKIMGQMGENGCDPAEM